VLLQNKLILDSVPFGMEMPGRNGYAVQGGWANSNSMINGQTYPADLSINNRTNNTPPEYTAANSVSFVGEYEDGRGDEYMAYILDGSNAPSSSTAGSGSNTSNGYRYGFNGQERDVDNGNDMYTAQFWEFDSRIGRRWNVDPLTFKFPWQSPYCGLDDNPIHKADPEGAKTESVHIDPKGNVLKDIKDGDNSVFVHATGITETDVTKTYTATDHSAGGLKVGELGKTIDANGIVTNVLLDNSNKIKNATMWEWKNKVGQDMPWDYKDNKSTIFGLAWDYDKTHGTTTNPHTLFTYKSYTMNAADFGNYHAGYTGSTAGISPMLQKIGAGYFEIKKNGNWWAHWNPATYLKPPYGDAPNDYKWNTQGMKDAPKRVSSPSPNQQTILHTMPYTN